MQHPLPPVPTLALAGARLRPLTEADAAALYDYLSDPRVTALTSFPDVTPAFAEAMVARSHARWLERGLPRWGLVLEGADRVVGTCGFNDGSEAHRWAEVAFDLAPACWGRGLMGRAVAAALRWAFEGRGLERVQGFVRVDNTRSQRLLERSGFVQEGRLRSFRVCRGQPHDFFLYGRLRSDPWAGGGGTDVR